MPPGFDPYPLVLLAAGMATLFVLIIRLKVHAFLALIGAALLVGLLSPRVVLQTRELDAYQRLHATVEQPARGPQRRATPQVLRATAPRRIPRGDELAEQTQPRLQLTNAPDLVAQAFGRLMIGIGLSIALATIIGAALMESGAADRIVRSLIRLFGERYAALAMLVSGYILGVPVFFDTVFLLLVPLARALCLRTGKNYLLYVIAMACGAAITHSLVPPTPGPIGMSELLNVDMGMTILVGLLVAVPAVPGRAGLRRVHQPRQPGPAAGVRHHLAGGTGQRAAAARQRTALAVRVAAAHRAAGAAHHARHRVRRRRPQAPRPRRPDAGRRRVACRSAASSRSWATRTSPC